MSKKPETIFAEKVDKDLKKAFGVHCHIMNINQACKVGDPDRVLCIKGHFIALELKQSSGFVAKLQITKLKQIQVSGGFALVVYPHTWHIILKYLIENYGN